MQKGKALIAPVKTVLHSYLSPIGLLNMLVPRLGYVVHESLAYGVGPAARYLRARAPQRTCVRIAIFLGAVGGAATVPVIEPSVRPLPVPAC
jgi:hypothetical protein